MIRLLINRTFCLVVIIFMLALALFSFSARADVSGDMRSFWRDLGAGANVTGPQIFEGQAAGYYTLGNIYARVPTRTSQIATLNLPSFRAGCGGIDSFAGAFSFINADEFVAMMKAVAANATGFAFQLAVETLSPVVAETMGQLREVARQVNLSNINSCETAQALVGGLWPRSDRASASICAAVGNSQGLFSDYAAGKHGCGAGGRRASTLDRARGDLAEQIPYDINYAWEATRKAPFLVNDDQLAQLFMSLTGGLIVVGPQNDNSPARRRILDPLVLDDKLLKALMEGGQLPIYLCDRQEGNIGKCLNPRLSTINLSNQNAFGIRVRNLLERLLEAIENDTAAPRQGVALVNMTALPLYKALNIYSAYNSGVARSEILGMSEAVALDIIQLYLTGTVREMVKAASALHIAGDDLDRWRDSLRETRAALNRQRGEGLKRFNENLLFVEKIRDVESILSSTLSNEVRRSIAYQRGEQTIVGE